MRSVNRNSTFPQLLSLVDANAPMLPHREMLTESAVEVRIHRGRSIVAPKGVHWYIRHHELCSAPRVAGCNPLVHCSDGRENFLRKLVRGHNEDVYVALSVEFSAGQ